MSNPNINFSMMSDETLQAYQASIAEQAKQLRRYKQATLFELGRRGLILYDLNQESTGTLYLEHMTTEQLKLYAEALMPRVDEAFTKLQAANDAPAGRQVQHNQAA